MEAIDVDGHLVRRLHDYRCPCIQGSPPRRRCAPVPRHRRYRPGPLQTHRRAVLGPPLRPHPWTPAVVDVVACCFDENRWLHATEVYCWCKEIFNRKYINLKSSFKVKFQMCRPLYFLCPDLKIIIQLPVFHWHVFNKTHFTKLWFFFVIVLAPQNFFHEPVPLFYEQIVQKVKK
jgi:hypothetical protein